jgi:hypothetical protein
VDLASIPLPGGLKRSKKEEKVWMGATASIDGKIEVNFENGKYANIFLILTF